MNREGIRIDKRAKAKLSFLKALQDNGGTLTMDEFSLFLGISEVTADKMYRDDKVLGVEIDGGILIPKFQLDQEQGTMFPEVARIMCNLKGVSSIMQYGFFVQVVDIYLSGTVRATTVQKLLLKGMTTEELTEIIRLACIFGKQDPA